MPQTSDSTAEETKRLTLAGFLSRTIAAYILMSLFVICTSVGAAFIYPPAGLITLGVTSGMFAYLLGSD